MQGSLKLLVVLCMTFKETMSRATFTMTGAQTALKMHIYVQGYHLIYRCIIKNLFHL